MKKLALLLCAALAAASVAGCSGNTESTKEASSVSETSSESSEETSEESEETKVASAESSEEEEELPEIGVKSEEAYEFVLTNGLSEAITEISVAKADAEFADTDKLNMNGNQIEADASVTMYYTPQEEQGADDTAADYKLKVVTASAAEYVITAFPADDMEGFSILSGEDAELGAFAYIEYNSVSTKEEVSTKEDEIAYLTEQKIAAEEAAAQAAAEQAAAEQAAAEQAAAEAAAAQAAAEQAAAEEAARQAAEAAAAQAAAEEAARQAAEEAARQEAAAQQQASQNTQDCANILG